MTASGGKNGTGTVTLTARVPVALAEAFDRAVKDKDLNKSRVLNDLVRGFVEGPRPEPPTPLFPSEAPPPLAPTPAISLERVEGLLAELLKREPPKTPTTITPELLRRELAAALALLLAVECRSATKAIALVKEAYLSGRLAKELQQP